MIQMVDLLCTRNSFSAWSMTFANSTVLPALGLEARGIGSHLVQAFLASHTPSSLLLGADVGSRFTSISAIEAGTSSPFRHCAWMSQHLERRSVNPWGGR